MARLNHKPGRKSNYTKSLNNDYHRSVREAALLRDNFMCQEEGCGSKIYLECHHISYLHRGKELEFMEDVVMLCEKHHSECHKNPNHKWNPKNQYKELKWQR